MKRFVPSPRFSFLVATLALLGALEARAVDDPIGMFRNTNYYMAFEVDYPREAKTEAIKTMEEKVIAMVGKTFFKNLTIEGSGTLADGRIVNWAGRIDGVSRYHLTKKKWGRGTGNCALKPFRTIAADPTQIPSGAVVKIAETVGMKLPDGTKSDGIWRAEDTGSAILHDRIDLFIGKKSYASYLVAAGIPNMKALTVTLVSHPLPDSCVFKNPE